MFFKYCIIENNTDSAYLDVSERNNRHLREIVNYDMELGHNSNICLLYKNCDFYLVSIYLFQGNINPLLSHHSLTSSS
jgi:hypothetical protein